MAKPKSTKLDLETAVKLISRAIRERGSNFVYTAPENVTACMNWHEDEGKPGCIVGLALSYLVGPDKVKELPIGNYASLLAHLNIDASPIVLDYLGSIQRAQDADVSWGQAAARGYETILDAGYRYE